LNTPTPVPVMVAPIRLDESPKVTPDPRARGRHTAPPNPGRRVGRTRVVGALVLVVVLVLGTLVLVRLKAAPPTAVVTSTMARTVAVTAGPVHLPWPPTGEAAVAVPSIGVDQASGPEQSVPIASLTKMMTAYVILHDHPLAPGANGPNIVISQADLDDYNSDTVNDEANAQVTLGEVLTERQVLGGMLVHSANNYADTLARWDAGSVPAFVAKMNRTAAQLGMDHTHYADASGFDQASQSTAGDLLKVAAPDMSNPTFASIVQRSSITLPVAGTISTYTPLLGIQGVIGVKSGFTTLAGGCDVLAVFRQVHGRSVLILAAVTGQTGPNVLVLAGLLALNLANNVATSISTSPVIDAGSVVAHVAVDGHTVDAVAQAPVSMLSWPGVSATRLLESTRTVTPGAAGGTRIGSVVAVLGGQRQVVPVRLEAGLPKETLLQRLF
jgi:serine-type D-Ala-D-Ala carboxypeptidase (penicillin-binding protein 5/6)